MEELEKRIGPRIPWWDESLKREITESEREGYKWEYGLLLRDQIESRRIDHREYDSPLWKEVLEEYRIDLEERYLKREAEEQKKKTRKWILIGTLGLGAPVIGIYDRIDGLIKEHKEEEKLRLKYGEDYAGICMMRAWDPTMTGLYIKSRRLTL